MRLLKVKQLNFSSDYSYTYSFYYPAILYNIMLKTQCLTCLFSSLDKGVARL